MRPGDHGFALAFAATADTLEVKVDGRIDTLDALIAMFLRITTEARGHGARRVLVIDHSEGVVPPEAGLRELACALGGSGFAALRMAYVDARGTAVGRMELGEIIGREHGYDCRVFDDTSRARLWLRYGEH